MAEKDGGIGYDAREYAGSKQLPFRTDVEWFTLARLADFRNAAVLDAGCGDGIYSRQIVDLGAKHVIGVDGDPDFIKIARENNSGYADKIEYHQAWIQNYPGDTDRDIAVGSYLFSYPKSPEEATQYAQSIWTHLVQGGKFIGFNNNPFEIFDGRRYASYGCEKEMHGDEEGSEVLWRVAGVEQPIVNFYLRPETYEAAFYHAGFSDFRWRPVLLDPLSPQPSGYWADFFDGQPPFIAMEAIK